MMLLQLITSLIVSSVYGAVSSDVNFQRFLDAYYSDLQNSISDSDNGTIPAQDDLVDIRVKPAPLPFPPDHLPGPPVMDTFVYESWLYSNDGFPYQKYGQNIATSNNLVAIGTSTTTPNSKVYLYQEQWVNNTMQGFTEIGVLTSHNIKQDGFGYSMALSKTQLIVGAPQDNSKGFSSGKVFVYASSGDPKIIQTLTPKAPQKGSLFGQAVSVFDNTLVIGAPGYSTDLIKSSGAVYVFQADALGNYFESSLINEHDELLTPFGQFGSVLSLYQNFLAVSAMGESSQVLYGGAVYLYEHTEPDNNSSSSTAQWVLSQKLQLDALPSYAYFGRTMSFSNSMGMIAAYNEEGSGIVYVYTKSGDSLWLHASTLLPTDSTDLYNNFGASLTMYQTSPDAILTPDSQPFIAVIGSPGDSTNYEMAGAIYVYGVKDLATSLSFMLLDKLTNNASTSYNQYGTSVAMSNGHVLVAATLADSPKATTTGVVYIEHDLLPYYLEVVDNVDVEQSDDVSASSGSSIASMVRDALLSTVGIVLMAVVPIVSVSAVLLVIGYRGGFSKHRYSQTGLSVDALGNTLDKDGNIIDGNKDIEESKETAKPTHSYFTNPLKRAKTSRGSADFSAILSAESPMVGTHSVELGVVYAPVGIHKTIPSPMNPEHTIYPSPITIPPRTKEVIENLDESQC